MGNAALNSSGEIQGDQDEIVSSTKSRSKLHFFRLQCIRPFNANFFNGSATPPHTFGTQPINQFHTVWADSNLCATSFHENGWIVVME